MIKLSEIIEENNSEMMQKASEILKKNAKKIALGYKTEIKKFSTAFKAIKKLTKKEKLDPEEFKELKKFIVDILLRAGIVALFAYNRNYTDALAISLASHFFRKGLVNAAVLESELDDDEAAEILIKNIARVLQGEK